MFPRAAGHALYKKGKLDPHLKPLFTEFRREQLYDTEADPNELNNLIDSTRPEHVKALTEMRAALDTWITETGDMGWKKEPPEKIEKFRAVMYDWFGAPDWYPTSRNIPHQLWRRLIGVIIED